MQFEEEIKGTLAKLKEAGLHSTVDMKDSLAQVRIDNLGLLRIYKTKKGAKLDYSQLPGHFRQRVMDALEPLKDEKVLGVDEAGKGDFFGPIVAAAVFVRKPALLRGMGVRDSKTLNDEKIIKLSGHIKKECYTEVVRINPERYNSMYNEMKNLNTLLAWMHAKAIKNALRDVKPDYVLSDKFASEGLLQGMVGKGVKLVQRTRAESNIAVAAASIVARAEFVLALQQLSFKYGMELPLGAGEPVDRAAKRFVKEHGRQELSKAAKVHFKTSLRI
jgi:ribonuclease HIII